MRPDGMSFTSSQVKLITDGFGEGKKVPPSRQPVHSSVLFVFFSIIHRTVFFSPRISREFSSWVGATHMVTFGHPVTAVRS